MSEATPDAGSPVYQAFRTVLGHVPTGVTVITAMTADGPVGMAVGTFSSISLDPPLVGFFVAKTSTTWPSIRSADGFCANVLGGQQQALCQTFARSGGDKFADVDWELTPAGMPLLERVVAWVDCRIEQVYDAGDHELCIGRVHDLDTSAHDGLVDGPLVFYRGDFGTLSESMVGGPIA
jgi:3-hydroxy-9,10-secoandrosta-1,3,5(10)-triene-9,17-dione monooxygenase reductase component